MSKAKKTMRQFYAFEEVTFVEVKVKVLVLLNQLILQIKVIC